MTEALNVAPGALLMTAAPVIDLERVRSIRSIPGGGEDCFRAAAHAYLLQAPLLLHRLQAALALGDAAALHGAAHTLKGSSATIGLARLAGTMGDLLSALASGEAAAQADLTAQARHEAGHAFGALADLLSRGDHG